MQATIIHNPRAGRLNVAHMFPAVGTALDEYGWRVKWCTVGVGHGNDAAALTRVACDEGTDAVFVAGGDGSAAAAASVLAGSGVALGILPCGTGNVWARGLGLSSSTHRWSRALVHAGVRQVTGVVRNVDVGRCNGHVFLLWAGIGLDGHIVHGIEPRGRAARLFGRWHYFVRGVWLARKFRGVSVRLHGENTGLDNEILGAVVTNVPKYAGGFATLEREAVAQNGRLALWAFRGHDFGDALVQFGTLLAGLHLAHRNVVRVVAPRFILESDSPLPLQLDGEPAGTASHYDINVLPGALRVFVPLRLGESGWECFWSG